MEGPTPVSALLHAATMVTAGVFLMIQFSNILLENLNALLCLQLVGGLTSVLAGLIASTQFDIKKVIAYSTCSQLGLMFVACGTANFSTAFYHLYTHAFFKALLFITAGLIIHAMFGEQDMRRLGGLLHRVPVVFLACSIASFSLVGIPPFSGFISKENIVYSLFVIEHPISNVVSILVLLAIVLTTFYSFKLIFKTYFTTYPVVSHQVTFRTLDFLPLLPLTLLSIIAAYIYTPQLLSGLPTNFVASYLSTGVARLPLIGTCIGIGFFVYSVSYPWALIVNRNILHVYNIIRLRGLFDNMYALIGWYLLQLSDSIFIVWERSLLEFILPKYQGTNKLTPK
jgi:NADH-quinone oxidoreductase subunit L